MSLFMYTPWGFLAIVVSLAQMQCTLGQFPPPPKDITILHSRFNDGVYISYKEVGSRGRLIIFGLRTTECPPARNLRDDTRRPIL